MFANVKQAFDMGAVAVGATIYFGCDESTARFRRSRRLSPGPRAGHGHRACGATCATTPSRRTAVDYHTAADLTGQANHLGVTIEADIIKQKLPTNNGGYKALKFGKTTSRSTAAHAQ